MRVNRAQIGTDACKVKKQHHIEKQKAGSKYILIFSLQAVKNISLMIIILQIEPESYH